MMMMGELEAKSHGSPSDMALESVSIQGAVIFIAHVIPVQHL